MQVKAIKPKKCKNCKAEFKPFKSTESVCSLQCSLSLAKVVTAQKEAKRQAVEHKLLKLKFTEKHKTLSEYEAEAKKNFQRWIRERDAGLPCISCGNPKPKEAHASHYFSAGQYSGLIFNEDNCHLSCDWCNVFLHGNLLEYRKGLIKRYGEAFVSALEESANSGRKYKYTKDELIEIKKKYSKPYTS